MAGEYWWITWVTRVAFFTSPTTLASGRSGKASRSSQSTLYMANSLCSKSTSIDGWKLAICRHSSEPMEPPAPVTSTTLPVSSSCRPASSSVTASRFIRSSTATLRIFGEASLPPATLSSDGTVSTDTLARLQISTTRRRTL